MSIKHDEKIAFMAIPARTIDSAEIDVIFVNKSITPVASILNKKALNVTIYGLLITINDEEVLVPTCKKSIANDAPKAAALESPRVYGDAKGFFKIHCITTPDIASPAPASIAPIIRTNLISQITRPIPALSNPKRYAITSSREIFKAPVFNAIIIKQSVRGKKNKKKL